MINDSQSVKLSPPWVTFANKVKSLFKGDPDVKVVYNDNYEIKLYVSTVEKAYAIEKILPSEKSFGNVKMKIVVIPPNEDGKTPIDYFKIAFESNPNVVDIVSIEDFFTNPLHYILFKKEVVQFYNDDGSNPHGVTSSLHQDNAADVFGDFGGIIYSTEVN